MQPLLRTVAGTWRAIRTSTMLFTLVLLSMTVLSIVSAVELRRSYLDRRHASDVAIQEFASLGARLFGDRAFYVFEAVRLQALAPILGMRWSAGQPMPPVRAFAVRARAELARQQFSPDDPNLGFFALDRITNRYEGVDAADDPAMGDSIRKEIRTRPMPQDTARDPLGWMLVNRAEPISVAYASLRDERGREVAVYGFTYSRRRGWKQVGDIVLRDLPILPAAWVDPKYRYGLDSARADSLVSIHLYDPDGKSLYASRPTVPGSLDGAFVFRGAGEFRAVASITPTLVAEMRRHVGGDDGTITFRRPGDTGGRAVPRLEVPAAVWLPTLSVLLALAAGVNLWRELSIFRARRDFVASVSHELRTPLAQIRMFTETLQLRREQDADERLRWLSIISREARRLGDLVENILLFSHIDADRARLEKERTDLGELIEEVVESYVPIAQQQAMRIIADAPSRIFAIVDPRAIRQIVVNLLDNAIKYGPRGQTVSIELERQGAVAQLSVSDQGPGIPVADRRRAWKPFVRLGRERGTSGGSGIGLAVVRDLARLHGATVGVDDAPGGGARFTVTIPVSEGADRMPTFTTSEYRTRRPAPAAAETDAPVE